MSFTGSIKTCFSKYVMFSGRAPRSEYWWFVLFVMITSAILTVIDIYLFGTTTTAPGSISGSTDFAPLSWAFMLVILLPAISVAVRRLHDLDKSGWWYWIALIPIVGFILLIVWFATKGTAGNNRFGPDPLS